MVNMKTGLSKRPLTVNEVDTLTAGIFRKGLSIPEFSRLAKRSPAECDLIIRRKKKLDQYEREELLNTVQ